MTQSSISTSIDLEEPIIEATEVIDEVERLNFLANHFCGNIMVAMDFESLVYNFANKMSEDYSGGFWNFFQLSNGGLLMTLDHDKQFETVSLNGSSDTLDGYDFGVFITSMALSHLSFVNYPEKITDVITEKYHCLRAYYLWLEAERLSKLCRLLD